MSTHRHESDRGCPAWEAEGFAAVARQRVHPSNDCSDAARAMGRPHCNSKALLDKPAVAPPNQTGSQHYLLADFSVHRLLCSGSSQDTVRWQLRGQSVPNELQRTQRIERRPSAARLENWALALNKEFTAELVVPGRAI